MHKPTLFAAAVLASAALLAPTSANAQAQSQARDARAVCGLFNGDFNARQITAQNVNIVITGSRVALREGPFTNGEALRVRSTGSALRACGLLRGNGSNSYTSKCGSAGRNWWVIQGNFRNSLGWSVRAAYVPVTCARTAN